MVSRPGGAHSSEAEGVPEGEKRGRKAGSRVRLGKAPLPQPERRRKRLIRKEKGRVGLQREGWGLVWQPELRWCPRPPAAAIAGSWRTFPSVRAPRICPQLMSPLVPSRREAPVPSRSDLKLPLHWHHQLGAEGLVKTPPPPTLPFRGAGAESLETLRTAALRQYFCFAL